MQQKLDNFITGTQGKPIEVEDSSALDQCMDLAFAWSDYLNIPHSSIRNPSAKDVLNNYNSSYWERVYVPQVGDLVIFNTGVGPNGHIGTYAGPNKIYEQNWNGVKKATLNSRPLDNVAGYLRPKGQTEGGDDVPIDDSTVNDLYSVLVGRPASDGDKAHWRGTPFDKAFYGIKDSPEGAAYAKAKIAGDARLYDLENNRLPQLETDLKDQTANHEAWKQKAMDLMKAQGVQVTPEIEAALDSIKSNWKG